MKKCGGPCKQVLPEEMFSHNRRNPDGLHHCCKQCKAIQDKAYQEKHKDKVKARKHEYYLANQKEISARTSQYAKTHVQKHREWCTKAKNKLKVEVFSSYSDGDVKCRWCGESDVDVLSIDHLDGNGADHRREIYGGNISGGSRFYFWLKKNNYPDGFQVLCFNCQFKKRLTEIRPENPTHLQQVRARYVRSIKLECLENYGGLRCDCGKDDADVLTLDHVNDDGAEHRRETGTRGFNFYMMLRKSGFPSEPPLQVMCLNCQIKKRQRKYEEGKVGSSNDSDGAALLV